MRVKVKGFQVGKSYNIFSNEHLDMYVYFSRKNYVLMSYYDENSKVEKRYTVSKRFFKDFLRLPFIVEIEEMDNEDFFKDFYNRYDEFYDDWSDDRYPCGCCSCCGCSCDDDLYYDYDYDE